MKKTLITALLSISLSACVEENSIKKAELAQAAQKAKNAVTECARNNVASSDDLTSDAMTIAKLLSNQCYSEYVALTDAAAAEAGNINSRSYRSVWESKQAEFFLPYVIGYRNYKRKAQ